MNQKTELLARAYFVVVIFSLLSMVIAYRVFKVSILEGDKWRQKGAVNVKWKELNADRGDIIADDGSLLATSIQFFEIRFDATVAKSAYFDNGIDSLAFFLAASLGKNKSKYTWKKELQAARKLKKRYHLIARNLNIDQRNLLRNFPIFRGGSSKGGLIEVKFGRRAKPFRELASRTIGEDRENAQKIGLEGYFDKFLRGPVDKVLQKRLTKDLWVPVYDPSEIGSRRGDDVITTLNVHLQDVVHEALSSSILKYNADKGVVILMETATGKIKAISNVTNTNGVITERLNTGIGERTEPGSTFKLATALALMETGKVDLDTKVNLFGGGPVKFNDKSIKDSEHHGKNTVTFKEAFAISSNIGMATLANQVFNKNTDTRLEFLGYLKQFGLDRVTQIEIEGEPLPLLKNPVKDEKTWYGTTIPWMAHGYELLLTPLQILTFYNGVANGGKVVKPYLVSEIKGEDGTSKSFEPRVLVDKMASTDNILKAQELLKEVVLTGTATNIKSENFMIAGKTGTTRVNYSNKEEYAKYNASFCGYFPAENPKYSMIVVLYNPQGVFYGSAVAAPIFKSIAEKTIAGQFDVTKPINLAKDSIRAKQTLPEANAGYADDFRGLFDYIGIPYKNKTNNEWAYVDPFEQKMLIENKKITKANVPDVRGMGARDAVFVLENLGLGVSVQGSGRVTRMSVTPGTPIRGQRIEIYLN